MIKIKPVSLYAFFHPETKEEFQKICTDDDALLMIINGGWRAHRVREIDL